MRGQGPPLPKARKDLPVRREGPAAGKRLLPEPVDRRVLGADPACRRAEPGPGLRHPAPKEGGDAVLKDRPRRGCPRNR